MYVCMYVGNVWSTQELVRRTLNIWPKILVESLETSVVVTMNFQKHFNVYKTDALFSGD